MDDLKELKDLISVLYFLLPGLLSLAIINRLVVSKDKDVFDKIVRAFLFTFINLVLFAAIRWILELIPGIAFDRGEYFTPGNLFLMISCAVAIGFAWAYELNNEPILQRLREPKGWKWRFTRRTYKPSTWYETFFSMQKYVVVHLEDGRRVYGWPRFFSDDPNERAVFLEDASWLNDKNGFVNDPRISVFLDKSSGIKLIEFLEPQDAKTNE